MSAPVDLPDPVQFVCTAKGHHVRRYPHVSFLATGMRFKCSACNRDTQIRQERFAQILADLRAAGISEVDISALPH